MGIGRSKPFCAAVKFNSRWFQLQSPKQTMNTAVLQMHLYWEAVLSCVQPVFPKAFLRMCLQSAASHSCCAHEVGIHLTSVFQTRGIMPKPTAMVPLLFWGRLVLQPLTALQAGCLLPADHAQEDALGCPVLPIPPPVTFFFSTCLNNTLFTLSWAKDQSAIPPFQQHCLPLTCFVITSALPRC